MTFPTNHIAFSWINQPAFSLPVYEALFNSAQVVIAGESPYLSNKASGIEFALHPDHRVRAAHLYGAVIAPAV
jgi:uracil DNA glycosylase